MKDQERHGGNGLISPIDGKTREQRRESAMLKARLEVAALHEVIQKLVDNTPRIEFPDKVEPDFSNVTPEQLQAMVADRFRRWPCSKKTFIITHPFS